MQEMSHSAICKTRYILVVCHVLFAGYRAEVSEILRLVTLINSSLTCGFVAQRLLVVLNKPIDTGDGKLQLFSLKHLDTSTHTSHHCFHI